MCAARVRLALARSHTGRSPLSREPMAVFRGVPCVAEVLAPLSSLVCETCGIQEVHSCVWGGRIRTDTDINPKKKSRFPGKCFGPAQLPAGRVENAINKNTPSDWWFVRLKARSAVGPGSDGEKKVAWSKNTRRRRKQQRTRCVRKSEREVFDVVGSRAELLVSLPCVDWGEARAHAHAQDNGRAPLC